MRNATKILYLLTIILCGYIVIFEPMYWLKSYAFVLGFVLFFDLRMRKKRGNNGRNEVRNIEIIKDSE